MIQLLKTIISNIRSPKWRIVYTKRNGDTDVYIISNPTVMKGSTKTTFSNECSRSVGQYQVGFRAKCLSREGPGSLAPRLTSQHAAMKKRNNGVCFLKVIFVMD